MKKFVCLGLAVLSMLLPINSFAATGIKDCPPLLQAC